MNNVRSNLHYVDGFSAAVPTANRDTCRHHAEVAAAVFMGEPQCARPERPGAPAGDAA